MLKRTVVMVVCMCLLGGYAAAEEGESESKTSLLDIIKEPIKTIFRPIEGGGLIDLIFKPVEAVISPVSNLGDMVVTPGRTPEYACNINKNVSVITSRDMLNGQDEFVQQALEKESSIIVSGYLGNAKDNSVDMRGFGETGLLNYLVLIDGRRTNQIDMSGADLSQIDINSIEKIEIIRGSSSVLYGDNATGGVVNIITKKGDKGDHIEYIQELGSYQYRKEYVSASGGHDLLDYFCSYSYQDSNGYRLNNGYEANDIFASITMHPGDVLGIPFSFSYHRDWYGLPGALYDGNIASDGREGSRYPNDKAKTEDWYFTLEPRAVFGVSDHEGAASVLVSYRSRRTNSRSVSFNIYEINHHISSFELRPKGEIRSSFLDNRLENKLVFGADYFHARDRVLSGDVAFTKSQLDIIKETFGIYATDNMLINKKFIINAGVRGEWAEYIFDQFQPASSYNTRSLREAAFDAGLGYKYNERSQVYANYARSYRYPATDEFFQSAYESFDWWTWTTRVFPAVLNTALKQQVGNNYEIGIKDNSFDLFKLSAAYYLIDNKNEIYLDPITYQNQNYHHTIHHGLELEARTALFDKIDVYFNYTFQKAFFVGGKFASKTIPLVPENMITGGVNVEPINGLNINLAVNYTGSRYIVSDQMNNVSKLKSHITLDLGIFYEIKNIRVFGSIKNLMGERYYSNATKNWMGNPAFYPAPVMNYEWGAVVRF